MCQSGIKVNLMCSISSSSNVLTNPSLPLPVASQCPSPASIMTLRRAVRTWRKRRRRMKKQETVTPRLSLKLTLAPPPPKRTTSQTPPRFHQLSWRKSCPNICLLYRSVPAHVIQPNHTLFMDLYSSNACLTACCFSGLSQCWGVSVFEPNRGGNLRCGVQSQGQKDRYKN